MHASSWFGKVHAFGLSCTVYQGADTDAEQLALTEQLFDAAALVSLVLFARGQPCLLVGDFNVEPTKIPCLVKGISSVRGIGVLLVVIAGISFMVGCPLAVAAVLSCKVHADRWIAPHLAVRRLFLTVAGGDLSGYAASAAHSPLACLLGRGRE